MSGLTNKRLAIGGRRYTSVEAIERFVERLNAAKTGSALPPKAMATSQRRAEQVERELERAGL